jgi:perosamine synthetase
MIKKIPLSKPWLTYGDSLQAKKAVSSGWLTQNGKYVKSMEQQIENFLQNHDNRKLVTSCSNGTTALHLALKALGIGPGDEVIIPNFCYVAVANCVLYCGATPVVVDISSSDWNIDVDSLHKVLTNKTKAIICTDTYGRIANYKIIKNLVGNRITLIQDSAESFPGKFNGVVLGNQGDISTFSFYANKIFTCGEGGAIRGDLDIIERIKILKNQGIRNQGEFFHEDMGFNYRLTNVNAAIFMNQWKRRKKILKRREAIFETYFSLLKKYNLNYETNYSEQSSPWLFSISLKKYMSDTKFLRQNLGSLGIETRPGFTPISKMKYFEGTSLFPVSLSVSEGFYKSVICLPTFFELTNLDIERVVNSIANFIQSK